MKKLILSSVLLLLFAGINLPQTIEKVKKDEISPELKKEAVIFLRETATDVNGLRTLENRISFQSEMANLMWFNDEKEARSMFQTVVNDFRQLLTQYDAQAVASGASSDADAEEEMSLGIGNRSEVSRKFSKAASVRQQIATSLAENDAQLAFDFLTDTAQTVTFPAFRKQFENDTYFQTRLLNQIAEQNVDAALKYGRKTLTKGFNYEHINLLKKIYAKDADKGAAFGEDVVAKIKSDGTKVEGFYYLSSLMSLGSENLEQTKGKSKTPIFSEQSLREIADLLAQEIMKREDVEEFRAGDYIAQIEKFSPARAAQIRQKFSIKPQTGTARGQGSGAGSGVAVKSNAKIAPSNAESEQEQQKQMMESLKNIDTRQLSKEERQKIVGQARKIIAGIKEPTAKLFALSALAGQIVGVDKELAVQIMDEAKGATNLQPKHYQDFLHLWLLAGGYAQVDADKAFPILEDAIFRINDTISAAVKIAEFVDTSSEIIEDGEIQIGSFGGGMTRELLRGLGATDVTIRSLAKSDFTRTKALTNKFDRPEARILAKMLVLRGVFAEKKAVAEE